MLRRFLLAWLSVLLLATPLLALEAPGRFKSVDMDKGVVVVQAGGQERTLKIDKDLKVLDKEGKDLADGLKNAEFKEGAEVTVTVEPQRMLLTAIRLGASGRPDRKQGGRPEAGEGKTSVGLKPLTEMTAQDNYKGE